MFLEGDDLRAGRRAGRQREREWWCERWQVSGHVRTSYFYFILF